MSSWGCRGWVGGRDDSRGADSVVAAHAKHGSHPGFCVGDGQSANFGSFVLHARRVVSAEALRGEVAVPQQNPAATLVGAAGGDRTIVCSVPRLTAVAAHIVHGPDNF
jgi:hypothetical protein